MKMLSFGEILWDVYPDTRAIGGACLNLAAHAALMGNEVYLASAVGEDELGYEALEVTRGFNVKDSYIKALKDKETGAVLVSLNEKGIPTYEIKDNVAYDFIDVSEISEKSFDVLVFGTLALRRENNIKTLESLIKRVNFKEIYTDLNIRLPHSNEKNTKFCLSNATILKVSDEELGCVSEWIFKTKLSEEDFATRLSEKYENLKFIIITKGADGSAVYAKATKEFTYAASVPVSVVSTVGAGDSFGAAFLHKYFEENSISECLNFAAKVSAYVCSKKEAVPNMPTIV